MNWIDPKVIQIPARGARAGPYVLGVGYSRRYHLVRYWIGRAVGIEVGVHAMVKEEQMEDEISY